MDAANNALGVAAAARLDGALEALAALPVRILADNGSSRSRPRRILARLQRILEGQPLVDEEDEEQGPAASGSRRRCVPDQVKLAGRIERHASRGSIRRAAAALDAAPLADTSDPAVIAKLRALHPEAAAPAALETDVPAIQISEETLVAVEKRLSANSIHKLQASLRTTATTQNHNAHQQQHHHSTNIGCISHPCFCLGWVAIVLIERNGS